MPYVIYKNGLIDFLSKTGYAWYMKNNVNYDEPIPMHIFQSCIDCGRFIRTNNKTKLTLFMMDHYGQNGIKRCSHKWYGEFIYTLLNWKYRNV
jgi:hypothetical protein